MMKKALRILWPVPFTLLIAWAFVSRTSARADAPAVVLTTPDRVDDAVVVVTNVLPPPSREMRMIDYEYRLADQLADAYADRRELAGNRYERLHSLATKVVHAAIDMTYGPTPKLSTADDWKYATTLMWIGHRETRLCHKPRLIGNEDSGKAHGPFQVWTWKGLDPYEPSTALDMLVNEASSWSLPQHEPWTGYPEAATWIKEHPFE